MKHKIIGKIEETLITPEELLTGTIPKDNINEESESLLEDFDDWLYQKVITAYIDSHSHDECHVCSDKANTEQFSVLDPISINLDIVPDKFLDKTIESYLSRNNWTVAYTNKNLPTAIFRYTLPEKEEELVLKLFTQWFNQLVRDKPFTKDKQYITMKENTVPKIFITSIQNSVTIVPSALIVDYLSEYGWFFNSAEEPSVTITVESETALDNINKGKNRLYSPSKLPLFVCKEKEKEKEAVQELLDEFTLWFNQVLRTAYLDKFSGNIIGISLDDIFKKRTAFIGANDSLIINAEKVPSKFITHTGVCANGNIYTVFKESIIDYLINKQWKVSADRASYSSCGYLIISDKQENRNRNNSNFEVSKEALTGKKEVESGQVKTIGSLDDFNRFVAQLDKDK